MTLSEMFVDQEAETFEQRRDEVVAIISAATDFAGADYGLRSFFETMCRATDESEFDEVFDLLVTSISETTPAITTAI
jgi:hypothetical protein